MAQPNDAPLLDPSGNVVGMTDEDRRYLREAEDVGAVERAMAANSSLLPGGVDLPRRPLAEDSDSRPVPKDVTGRLLRAGKTPAEIAAMSPMELAMAEEGGRAPFDPLKAGTPPATSAFAGFNATLANTATKLGVSPEAAAAAIGANMIDPNPAPGAVAPAGGAAGREPVMLTSRMVGGSRGQWVPEHEQHLKRTVEAELGVPIPEEAMGLYGEANDILREDAALARLEAAKEAGRIEAAKRQGVLEVEQRAIKTQQRLAEEQQAEYQRYRQHYEAAEIDPSRVWNSKTTMQKILATIGMAFGGFAATVKGGPNFALQLLQSEINEDINAQRENRAAIKASLDSLGVKHQQEDADVDLERVKRLKAVEQMAEQQLAAMGVDDKTMGAAHAELLAKIREAQADLIDKAALRAAGKVTEQNQFGTVEGQYVGGSAGHREVTGAMEAYQAIYTSAKAGKASETEARAAAAKVLKDAGLKDEQIAPIAVAVHSSLPLPSSAEDDETDPNNPKEQIRRNAGYVNTGNGEGVVLNGANSAYIAQIQGQFREYQNTLDSIARLRELVTGTGVFGSHRQLPLSERANLARQITHGMYFQTNYVFKDDAVTAGELGVLKEIVADPSKLFGMDGMERLNELERTIRLGQDTLRNTMSGPRARMRLIETPNGLKQHVDLLGPPGQPGLTNEVRGGDTNRKPEGPTP